MSDKLHAILVHDVARRLAANWCMTAPLGYHARIEPPTRTLEQNAKFHTICEDIAKQKEFGGKLRSPAQWKMLLVSGHAIATKRGSEMMPGIEGEWCNLRESTASMGVKRLSSLIEYAIAYCAGHEIRLRDGGAE